MKSQISLFSLFILLIASSCGGVNLNKQKDNAEARIDSMVSARVDSLFNRLKMQNDSIINAKANAKAQEIISAKSK